MRPFRPTPAALLLCAGLALPAAAEIAPIAVPREVATHADGRAPIQSLYRSWLGLLDRGWKAELVVESMPEGTRVPLPIVALRSPRRGPATWILAGIHGEEPAGPNAIAVAIGDIARLGETHPVVLLPLLNPHGYARNWRYLNVAAYSEAVDGASVGDSSHLLPAAPGSAVPRSEAASSAEADAITAFVLHRMKEYPPLRSIDLHEDSLIDEGYVYSQGTEGASDPLATAAVAVLRESGVPIKPGGTTRFGERIEDGIIGPVTDSSIDELMSAATVIADGEPRPGPAARTVLVFETPAAALPLPRRVAAHAALLRRLAVLIGSSPPVR